VESPTITQIIKISKCILSIPLSGLVPVVEDEVEIAMVEDEEQESLLLAERQPWYSDANKN